MIHPSELSDEFGISMICDFVFCEEGEMVLSL